jgi:predicted DNA-binding transcriptional regulator AlpA
MELFDKDGLCHYFGDIHPSTAYRKIKQGLLPKPIKIGGSSRWLRTECEAVLQAMVDGRAR